MQIQIQCVRLWIDGLNFFGPRSLPVNRSSHNRQQQDFCRFHSSRMISGGVITCKLIRTNILYSLRIPKNTQTAKNQFFQLRVAPFLRVYNFLSKFFLASTGLRCFVRIPEVLMNVHISYRLHKTPAVEKDLQHQIEKLRKRLQVFRPELIHLKGMVEEISAREGTSVSLNLRLPSGQMAVQSKASTAAAAVKTAFEDLLQQV